MRPRCVGSVKHAVGGRRRESGVGHGGRRLAVGLIVAAIVVLVVAASASASPPTLREVVTGDLPRVVTPLGPKQAASSQAGSPLWGGIVAPADPTGQRGTATAGDIFYDGFEGASPPWWMQGDPTWGFTPYLAAAGLRSAYCAQDGIGAPGPYANNMDAWQIAGPFDLSAVTAATFDFKLNLSCELNYDVLWSLVSIDGTNFWGLGATGDSAGWIDMSRDLTAVPTLGNVCGQSQVWIAFNFTSDASNTDEGAYVDEVRVGGTQAGLKPIDFTISKQPLIVRYNGTVTISGTLSDANTGLPLANRTVELDATEDATTPLWLWDVLGNVDSAAGQFAVQVSGLQRRTYFYWWFNGDSQYDMGFSDQIKVMARAKLTPPAFGASVGRGVLVTKWGTLLPRHSAAANQQSHTKIYFYRYSNGKWRLVAANWAKSYRNTTSATMYSVRFRWPVASKWRVRAVHVDADHAKTTSSWRYFRVL